MVSRGTVFSATIYRETELLQFEALVECSPSPSYVGSTCMRDLTFVHDVSPVPEMEPEKSELSVDSC